MSAPDPNAVLDQVATVLGTVSGLTTVLKHRPTMIAPDDYPFALVYIRRWKEYRHAYGGAINQGRKRREYQVAILVHSVSFDANADQATFYTLISDIEDALRANQTLAGVTIRFGEDIDTDLDPPTAVDGQAVQFNATIASTAIEEFQG